MKVGISENWGLNYCGKLQVLGTASSSYCQGSLCSLCSTGSGTERQMWSALVFVCAASLTLVSSCKPEEMNDACHVDSWGSASASCHHGSKWGYSARADTSPSLSAYYADKIRDPDFVKSSFGLHHCPSCTAELRHCAALTNYKAAVTCHIQAFFYHNQLDFFFFFSNHSIVIKV